MHKGLNNRLIVILASSIIASGLMLVFGFYSSSRTLKQLGALGIAISLANVPLLFVSAPIRRKWVFSESAIVISSLIFLLSGEAALRFYFWGGESFGPRYGPIVRDFEKNFQFNQFDGPSRGPEPIWDQGSDVRILVQGDSITWGQGIKSEENIYTSVLLSQMRTVVPKTDMAVLAKPGREIDTHVEQLEKWAAEIQPNLIIYQWYINDIDVNKQYRPASRKLVWRRAFFHRYLIHRSYFWFFLDYRLHQLSATPGQSYEDYLVTHYAPGSEGWLHFESLFKRWCDIAADNSSKVLVLLYPHLSFPPDQPARISSDMKLFHDRVAKVCDADKIRTLDLTPSLTIIEDSQDIWSGPFDKHPNERAHKLMARNIYRTLNDFWPEIYLRREDALER